MSITSIFHIAGSALTAQSQRMNVAASNLANANSLADPNGQPYRAKEVVFRAQGASGQGIGGVEVSRLTTDPAPLPKRYEPGNPLADAQGYVRLPNVNPTDEMINMISAARSYQASVQVLDTSKQLMLRTLNLGQ